MPSAIGFILTIFVMVSYFLKKGTYLRIAYAGDTTDLAVKMYPYHTVLKFHKKLRAVIEG